MDLRAALIFVATLTVAACSTEEASTPKCDPDAGPHDSNACNPLAQCRDKNGNESNDYKVCCVDAEGKLFEGTDLDNCVYGFGIPGPGTGGAGGGGGTGGGSGGSGGGMGGSGGGMGGTGGGMGGTGGN